MEYQHCYSLFIDKPLETLMSLFAVTLNFYSGKRVVVSVSAPTAGAASNEAVMRHGAMYASDVRFCGALC